MNTTCEFCERTFSIRRTLIQHYQRCKKKPICDQRESYEQHFQELLEQKNAQRDSYEQQLQYTRNQHEQQLEAMRIQYEQQLQSLREQLQEFKTQLFDIARQPKQMTTTHYNNSSHTKIDVAMQLAPYDLTPERRSEILSRTITEADWDAGYDAYVFKVMQSTLFDAATGKPKVICTDKTRLNCKLLDPETNEITVDHGFQRTHGILRNPVLDNLFRLYNRIRAERGSDEEDGKYFELIRQTFYHAEKMGRQFLRAASKIEQQDDPVN